MRLQSGTAEQFALSLQHARRIVQATREWNHSAAEGYMDSAICWIAAHPSNARALFATAKAVWDASATVTSSESDEDVLPFAARADGLMSTETPLLAVLLATDGLPRSASVEWQITASSGRSNPSSEDLDSEYAPPQMHTQAFVRGGYCVVAAAVTGAGGQLFVCIYEDEAPGAAEEESRATHTRDAAGPPTETTRPASHADNLPQMLAGKMAQALHWRIFHTGTAADADAVTHAVIGPTRSAVSHVPVLDWALLETKAQARGRPRIAIACTL